MILVGPIVRRTDLSPRAKSPVMTDLIYIALGVVSLLVFALYAYGLERI